MQPKILTIGLFWKVIKKCSSSYLDQWQILWLQRGGSLCNRIYQTADPPTSLVSQPHTWDSWRERRWNIPSQTSWCISDRPRESNMWSRRHHVKPGSKFWNLHTISTESTHFFCFPPNFPCSKFPSVLFLPTQYTGQKLWGKNSLQIVSLVKFFERQAKVTNTIQDFCYSEYPYTRHSNMSSIEDCRQANQHDQLS